MREPQHALVMLRLKQAREDLEVAKQLYEFGSPPRIIVNRLYYSCFYSVCALLVTRGLDQSKHSGVRSQFAQHFIKSGEFPRELGRHFNRVFDARLECDYEDREVLLPAEDILQWMNAAEELLFRVEEYLKR